MTIDTKAVPAIPPRLLAMFHRQRHYGLAQHIVLAELGGRVAGQPLLDALVDAGVVDLVDAHWGKGHKVYRLAARREASDGG
jgi:hypothetical protein